MKKANKAAMEKHHEIRPEDYDLVISHYKNLITRNENVIDAYNNMGFIYIEKEEYEEALKCFLKILEMTPRRPAP